MVDSIFATNMALCRKGMKPQYPLSRTNKSLYFFHTKTVLNCNRNTEIILHLKDGRDALCMSHWIHFRISFSSIRRRTQLSLTLDIGTRRRARERGVSEVFLAYFYPGCPDPRYSRLRPNTWNKNDKICTLCSSFIRYICLYQSSKCEVKI